MSFNNILERGIRRHKVKDILGKWGVCEYCDARRHLFQYRDNKDSIWMLCNDCCNAFIKDESET